MSYVHEAVRYVLDCHHSHYGFECHGIGFEERQAACGHLRRLAHWGVEERHSRQIRSDQSRTGVALLLRNRDRYTVASTEATAIWSEARVPTHFIQVPPLPNFGPLGGNIKTNPLNILYASVADHFVRAGASVANADGSFTFWRKCALRPCMRRGSHRATTTGIGPGPQRRPYARLSHRHRRRDMPHVLAWGFRFGSAEAAGVAGAVGAAAK